MQEGKQSESLQMTYEFISLCKAVTKLLLTLERSAFIDRILVTSSLLLRLKGDAWILTNSPQPHFLSTFMMQAAYCLAVCLLVSGDHAQPLECVLLP